MCSTRRRDLKDQHASNAAAISFAGISACPRCSRPSSPERPWSSSSFQGAEVGRAPINRAEGATRIPIVSVQCRFFFVFGNRARQVMLRELLFPIHVFQDLLAEQSGFAPTLGEPRPGMSSIHPHDHPLSVTPPSRGHSIAQLASFYTTVVSR